MSNRTRRLFIAVALLAAVPSAWSEHISQHKSANGMDIYYGVVPLK